MDAYISQRLVLVLLVAEDHADVSRKAGRLSRGRRTLFNMMLGAVARELFRLQAATAEERGGQDVWGSVSLVLGYLLGNQDWGGDTAWRVVGGIAV